MAEKQHPILLYAPTIHDAITSGDLSRMKQVAQEAEQYLQQSGDLPAALQALKIEIAKAEHKK
ncbi:MAG: DUF1843 domain-containing protein [Bryobacteraceae bacterium]|jgi:uncharacterized protein DUF1843